MTGAIHIKMMILSFKKQRIEYKPRAKIISSHFNAQRVITPMLLIKKKPIPLLIAGFFFFF
jgi:hypothetical protein